ncbi:hypothetical protein B4U80_14629, partial [Leptotrombidium deliense]
MFSQLVKVAFALLFALQCECRQLATKSLSTDNAARIGIVGAGVTGLYTALLLNELGIDYELLEASNRTGGP